MDRRAVPYRKTVFVCTNSRTDGRIACANPGRGGLELCGRLKEEIKSLGLKKQIRVARSGCLDRCAEGPNLFLYPEGEWFSRVDDADLPEILKKIAS